MQKLKILCLNCFGSPISFNRSTRFKLIAKEIEKLNPDLVMLQEVITPSHKEILSDELGKFGWKFYSNRNGFFESGGLIMLSKKLELTDLKFHKFDEQGPINFLSLTDRFLGKGFQTTSTKINNKDILIINTHLLCLYSKGTKNINAQRKQFNQLTSFIKDKKINNVILSGDLNADPTSVEVLNLEKSCNLFDTLYKTTPTIDPSNLNRHGLLNMLGNGKPYRTDYILISNNLNLKESGVVFDKTQIINNKPVNLSDHYGIIANLEV